VNMVKHFVFPREAVSTDKLCDCKRHEKGSVRSGRLRVPPDLARSCVSFCLHWAVPVAYVKRTEDAACPKAGSVTCVGGVEAAVDGPDNELHRPGPPWAPELIWIQRCSSAELTVPQPVKKFLSF
jgi:hypothetical protein